MERLCRITDEEYDYIIMHTLDSELELLTELELRYKQKKRTYCHVE